MRIGSTGPLICLTGQSRKVTAQTRLDICVPWSVGWSLVPHTFPRMSCSLGFHRLCLQHYYVVCTPIMIKRPQPTHGQSVTSVALDHRVHATSNPMSKLVSMQSPAPASSLAEPPPASPQLGRWICRQGLRSARVRCLLLVLAAAVMLLLLLRRRLLLTHATAWGFTYGGFVCSGSMLFARVTTLFLCDVRHPCMWLDFAILTRIIFVIHVELKKEPKVYYP